MNNFAYFMTNPFGEFGPLSRLWQCAATAGLQGCGGRWRWGVNIRRGRERGKSIENPPAPLSPILKRKLKAAGFVLNSFSERRTRDIYSRAVTLSGALAGTLRRGRSSRVTACAVRVGVRLRRWVRVRVRVSVRVSMDSKVTACASAPSAHGADSGRPVGSPRFRAGRRSST